MSCRATCEIIPSVPLCELNFLIWLKYLFLKALFFLSPEFCKLSKLVLYGAAVAFVKIGPKSAVLALSVQEF